MRLMFLIVCVFMAFPAKGQGVRRERLSPEALILTRNLVGAITVTTYNSTVVPSDRSYLVTAVKTRCTTAGSGAGNIVWRITDGTRTCDCTASCTATGVAGYGDTGSKSIPCTGACLFPSGSAITFSVQTAGCATSQPSVTTPDLWARPVP